MDECEKGRSGESFMHIFMEISAESVFCLIRILYSCVFRPLMRISQTASLARDVVSQAYPKQVQTEALTKPSPAETVPLTNYLFMSYHLSIIRTILNKFYTLQSACDWEFFSPVVIFLKQVFMFCVP